MKVSKLDNGIKYWVVRPGRQAVYFEHFKTHDLVALGHMDEVTILNEGMIDESHLESVEKSLKKIQLDKPADEAETKTQRTVKLGQIKTFIREMNIGDVIFTIKPNHVLVGTIISAPYIEKTPIRIVTRSGKYSKNELTYMLRRDVKWDQEIPRENIPVVIRTSLTAHQTVFSLDVYREIINHWLYSMFTMEDTFYFSTKIDQQKGVEQFHFTEFQRLIQKLELVSEKICECDFLTNEININELICSIDQDYVQYGLNDKFTLTTKNIFMSPGNTWSSIKGPSTKIIIFAMLLNSMFEIRASSDDEKYQKIIKQNESIVQLISEELKKDSSFEQYRQHLKANLDKPHKKILNVSEIIVKNSKKEVIFPAVKDVGETAL